MTPTDAVVAIIVSLFVAGGPVVAWINARAAKQPRITTEQVEIQSTSTAAKELGIEDRWKEYADEVEERLDKRIAALEDSLKKSRESFDASMRYVEILREHIYKELPPPPPPWPSDII